MLDVQAVQAAGQVVDLHAGRAEPPGVRLVVEQQAADAAVGVDGRQRPLQLRPGDPQGGLPQPQHGEDRRVDGGRGVALLVRAEVLGRSRKRSMVSCRRSGRTTPRARSQAWTCGTLRRLPACRAPPVSRAISAADRAIGLGREVADRGAEADVEADAPVVDRLVQGDDVGLAAAGRQVVDRPGQLDVPDVVPQDHGDVPRLRRPVGLTHEPLQHGLPLVLAPAGEPLAQLVELAGQAGGPGRQQRVEPACRDRAEPVLPDPGVELGGVVADEHAIPGDGLQDRTGQLRALVDDHREPAPGGGGGRGVERGAGPSQR